MERIITQYIYPPIPDRSHDWTAYIDGKEDGVVGYGATEKEALADLYQQLEDEAQQETLDALKQEHARLTQIKGGLQ